MQKVNHQERSRSVVEVVGSADGAAGLDEKSWAELAAPAKRILALAIAKAVEEEASDIQFQSDCAVYFCTNQRHYAHTFPNLSEYGSLNDKLVGAIYRVLWDNRVLNTSYSAFKVPDSPLEALRQGDGTVDFACEGGPLSIGLPDEARLRVQAFSSMNGLCLTLRVLRQKMMKLEELRLPEIVYDGLLRTVAKKEGIGFICGPTGSGKTTTAAGLIDHVRRNYQRHIVTIEDPIEYAFSRRLEGGARSTAPDTWTKSLITQQEVGLNVPSFYEGLRTSLRKHPDIIFVAEMRDGETAATALEAAETGHLVLTTLHTASCSSSVSRIMSFFQDPARAVQVVEDLAERVSFVLVQRLVPTIDGGVTLCCEWFDVQSRQERNAIRNYATKGNKVAIENELNKGKNLEFNTELKRLLNDGRIDQDTLDRFLVEKADENAKPPR